MAHAEPSINKLSDGLKAKPSIIENAVKQLLFLPVEEILPFQDDLKVLDDENYARLKGSIIKYKFSSPIHIWKHDGKWHSLDGHQRCNTVLRMREEGFTIPKLPCVEIAAKSHAEAKEKILALTSQYGRMTKYGLLEYLSVNKIDILDAAQLYNFPELKWQPLIEEYTLAGIDATQVGSFDDEAKKFIEEHGLPTKIEKLWLFVEFPDTQKEEFLRLQELLCPTGSKKMDPNVLVSVCQSSLKQN
jgi:hypothetical protein